MRNSTNWNFFFQIPTNVSSRSSIERATSFLSHTQLYLRLRIVARLRIAQTLSASHWRTYTHRTDEVNFNIFLWYRISLLHIIGMLPQLNFIKSIEKPRWIFIFILPQEWINNIHPIVEWEQRLSEKNNTCVDWFF